MISESSRMNDAYVCVSIIFKEESIEQFTLEIHPSNM